MRVIGLFTAWGARKWAHLAIGNHLKIVDQLHVMIAPHNNRFAEIGDNTDEVCRDMWGSDKRVTFHTPEPGNIKGVCDRSKCILLNQMRKVAKPEIGDIVMICDSDEFYDDAAVKEIRAKFDGPKWDCLDFRAMYFAVNMRWYMIQEGLTRMFRIMNRPDKDEFHFKPTQRPIPKPEHKQTILMNNPLFHYSLLMPLKYKRIHWSSEMGVDEAKMKWIDEVYAKWDPTNPGLCEQLAKNNPTHGDHFYCNNDPHYPKQPPYMYKYDGRQPDEIEMSPLVKVEDFRVE